MGINCFPGNCPQPGVIMVLLVYRGTDCGEHEYYLINIALRYKKSSHSYIGTVGKDSQGHVVHRVG